MERRKTFAAALAFTSALGLMPADASASGPVWYGQASVEGIAVGRDRVQIHLPDATSTDLCPNTDSGKWFEIDTSDPSADDMLKAAFKAIELGWNVEVRSNTPICHNGYIRIEILQLLPPTP